MRAGQYVSIEYLPIEYVSIECMSIETRAPGAAPCVLRFMRGQSVCRSRMLATIPNRSP